MDWIKLTDRMPNPDEHGRVLIYTEGYDFNGEQVFDVKAETLNECFYADPEDQPEVCRHASHWAAHPRNAALRAQSYTEVWRRLAEVWRRRAEAWHDLAEANAAIVDEIRGIVGLTGKPGDVVKAVLELVAAQAGKAHPDDAAVDAFAAAMKEKLAAARAKGRGGWNGDEPGMQQRLSDMLRAHVEKGDPRDVANFCMFLHQRGESILPQQKGQPAVVDEAMVKRFLEAFRNTPGDEAIGADEKVARRWLTAALAAQQQEPTT